MTLGIEFNLVDVLLEFLLEDFTLCHDPISELLELFKYTVGSRTLVRQFVDLFCSILLLRSFQSVFVDQNLHFRSLVSFRLLFSLDIPRLGG